MEVVKQEPEPSILHGEADALSQCYEKLEEELETKLKSKVVNGICSEQPTQRTINGAEGIEDSFEVDDFVKGEDEMMEDEDATGNEDRMLCILSTVDVSMDESMGTSTDGDEQQTSYPFLNPTEELLISDFDEDTMSSTLSGSGVGGGDSSHLVDPLSPSPLPSSSASIIPQRNNNVTITCRFCQLSFYDPKSYYQHRKEQHPKESKSLVIPSFHEAAYNNAKCMQLRICPLCGESRTRQNTIKHFMEHMLSHEMVEKPITTVTEEINPAEDEGKPFACDHCDQRFLLEINLDLHKICYHESNVITLKCQDCGDTSSRTWEDLVSHLADQHRSNTIYSCKSCPMAFTTADQLLEHMNTHSLSNRLPCSECPSVSPSLKELYQHFHESHPNLIKTLWCELCHEMFLMPRTYRRHFATVHPLNTITPTGHIPVSISNIQCPHCLEIKIFKNKLTLENHIRIHHDTTVIKHSCEQCGKAFVHRSTLRYHIQQVHLGIRYKCEHCPKSFTSKSLLRAHLKLHSGLGPPVLTCFVCNGNFASKTALKTHTITQHGNPEPSTCDICEKEFQNVYSLRTHKSEVHNLKQWSCPHCTMQYARVKQFEKHLETHNLTLVAVKTGD